MKTVIATLVLIASVSCGIMLAGCETSHTETDKPGLFGGQKHEETTTTKNPITGETSTSHSEQVTH